MDGPWIDWTDAQMLDAVRAKGKAIDPAYNDLLAELNRRAANRQARDSRILSIVSVVIAVVAVLVTAWKS